MVCKCSLRCPSGVDNTSQALALARPPRHPALLVGSLRKSVCPPPPPKRTAEDAAVGPGPLRRQLPLPPEDAAAATKKKANTTAWDSRSERGTTTRVGTALPQKRGRPGQTGTALAQKNTEDAAVGPGPLREDR